ncbi:MAG: hypothetical protein IGS50_08375 [Synechococcales cyanobacterium C42_A2020_086]|jgi:tetratricopeptide (TPR) repeat protein|nr:hypothetical protein [Synechococcales cyanobacterium C42_A2020_086]
MVNAQQLDREHQYWTQIIQSNPSSPKAYVQRGMVRFKQGEIALSIQDFDRAEQLNPRLTPYLWQRGLSYYYADRFAEGAQQFEIDLTVNAHDVEETVWRYLCMARQQGIATAQASLLVVRNDPRRVMRAVYDLYAGVATPEQVIASGTQEGSRGAFYSHLYVGLYYEAAVSEPLARFHITRAVAIAQTDYRADDYMCALAVVHQKLRKWVD